MSEPTQTPPSNFEELRNLIAQRHAQLSARLQEIAEFTLAHPEEVALETVAGLARKAGVPPSAMVRFAQALGYEGFSQLQRVFRARLVTRLPSYAERIRQARSDHGPSSPPLHAFAEATLRAVNRTRSEVSEVTLRQAAELLAGADIIHLLGQRRSFPVVAYLAYAFSHLGCRTQLVDGVGGMRAQQLETMRPGDVLVAVSFKPYAEETVAGAKEAGRRKLPLLAITDSPLSPLARQARASLFVADPEVQGVRGLSASMCAASALVLALGRRLVEEGDVALQERMF